MQVDYGEINYGLCPHCLEKTHMMETEQKDIFQCAFCYGETKIYINGKVKFIKVTVPVINVKEEQQEDTD
jgi:hypothetical protein